MPSGMRGSWISPCTLSGALFRAHSRPRDRSRPPVRWYWNAGKPARPSHASSAQITTRQLRSGKHPRSARRIAGSADSAARTARFPAPAKPAIAGCPGYPSAPRKYSPAQRNKSRPRARAAARCPAASECRGNGLRHRRCEALAIVAGMSPAAAARASSSSQSRRVRCPRP